MWSLERPSQCRDLSALKNQIRSSLPEKIWFLDVQPQMKGWVAFCPQGSSGELIQNWQEGISLQELLPLFADDQRFVIFNLHASQKSQAEDFLDLTKSFEKSDHVAAISPSRIPIETLRKERPQWFFGADRTTLTKVQAFQSFHLVGLVDPWADFYVITESDSQNLSPSVLEYLNQRNKVLIRETSAGETSPPSSSFYRGSLPLPRQ